VQVSGAAGRSRPDLPPVIGHRGAAASAPENTLAGMRAAHRLGARWVEFDVRLTADAQCIVLHDDTVNRTSDGSGAAALLSFAALRRYDAGGWFDKRFAGERIPSFAEVIDLLAELGLGANVEIKPAAGQEAETARAAVGELQRNWPAHLPPPLLSSFSPVALAAAHDAAPAIARGYLFGRLPGDWRAEVERLGCATVHCDERRLDQVTARAVIAAGYPLLAYTVNRPARARELLGWGLSAVFTDCPDRIIAGLFEKSSPNAPVIHT
jgi:glycerophosphoryl diester phosphodiesterase